MFRAVETLGYPECSINLAHGVVYLANAPKDRRVYYAIGAALADAQKHGNLPVPMSIRNASTNLMKDLGYGKGYEKYTAKDLLPEKINGTVYFPPKAEIVPEAKNGASSPKKPEKRKKKA